MMVGGEGRERKRVLVIGGGVAGMQAIRHFSASGAFEVLCVEQLAKTGGLWNYCEPAQAQPTGSAYTAIYENLKTNIPKHLMSFGGLPYPAHLASFIHHTDVIEYLDHAAQTFDLDRHIKFNTKVLSVRPKRVLGQEDSWEVEWVHVITKEKETRDFDIVIVCNGSNSEPIMPVLRGLETFQGVLMHSQKYRRAGDFKDKEVLLVGVGPSGIDIAIEILSCAKKVWLCNRQSGRKSMPAPIEQVGGVVEVSGTRVVVKKRKDFAENKNEKNEKLDKNGEKKEKKEKENIKKEEKTEDATSELNGVERAGGLSTSGHEEAEELLTIDKVDAIICCTGYRHSFPFLSADCGVSVVSEGVVAPLFKDTVCMGRQNLAFIGLHLYGSWLLFEYQAKFLVAFYEGKFRIPGYGKELLAWVAEDDDKKKKNEIDVERKPFCTPFYQYEIMRQLASLASLDAVPEGQEKLFREIEDERTISQTSYKDIEYELAADGFYVHTGRKKDD